MELPLHQATSPFWVHVRGAENEVASKAEECPNFVSDRTPKATRVQQYYPNQCQRLPHPESSSLYRAVDLEAAYQFTKMDLASATNHPPLLQERPQPQVVSFIPPPSSLPIQIPTPHNTLAELSPFSSLSTSASTSSSAGAASPDLCRQSQPHFDEQKQQWSCSGCNKTFSDKYGTERHISTVGLKVTCRYCGSRVSALESSRRRHFRREACRNQAIQQGFITRNEQDAFIEDP